MQSIATVRVIPQYRAVRRAVVREDGRTEEVDLPEGTDDVTAMHRLDGLLKESFRKDPGACFTWKLAGPKDDGTLLVVKVPHAAEGGLLWEKAKEVLEDMARKAEGGSREGRGVTDGMRRAKSVPTIEQIRAFKYSGNHAQDGGRFDAISRFVGSDAPMAEKREALQRMQRDGMGVDEPVTEQDVLDYLAEA